MSKRRCTLLPRYCRARGAMRGLTNSHGSRSSGLPGGMITSPSDFWGTRTKTCYGCHGTGHINLVCRNCDGTGTCTGKCRLCAGTGQYKPLPKPCRACNATGKHGRASCRRCAGTGKWVGQSGTCKKCSGQGKFCVPCRKCSGTGTFTVGCKRCSGSGVFLMKKRGTA